jgi:hypothetical protein
MSSQSGPLSAFDPLSQWRLRIFGFKLLILFPFAILLAVRYRYALFNPSYGMVSDYPFVNQKRFE